MNNCQDKVAEVAMVNQVPVYNDDITDQERLGQVTNKIVHNLMASAAQVLAVPPPDAASSAYINGILI